MSSREKEQTIALSAIFQAAELVSILAKTGQVDNASLQPLLESLLMVNAASTEDLLSVAAMGLLNQSCPGKKNLSTSLRQRTQQCKS